jgi:hypothetical protein
MRYLVKYVIVTASGFWLDMGREQDMRPVVERTPGTHLERWTYPVLPDGTHGDPVKQRLD